MYGRPLYLYLCITLSTWVTRKLEGTNVTAGDFSTPSPWPYSHPTASPAAESALMQFVRLKEARGYDYGLSPVLDPLSPVVVSINLQINNILGLNEADMEYSIDAYFRQKWLDPRLAYADEIPGQHSIGIPDRYYADIWLPDTYFENGKEEALHSVTMDNVMFRVYPDGTVVYSQRLRLVLWCTVRLHHFPMDTQNCDMHLYSYRYATDELTLRWLSNKPLEVMNNEMGMYTLGQLSTGNCTIEFFTGSFSCIYGRLEFIRRFGFYVTQVYVPSILIILLSWVSFWLDPHAVPARVSLGILTILAMASQLSTVASSSLPKVSYISSLDIWLITCMSFLCLAVVEFAVANTLARKEIAAKRPKEERMQGAESDNQKGWLTSRSVDMGARIFFPGVFLVFNCIYWPVFLH